MNTSLGHKAAKGAIWATIDKVCMMTLQFGVNLFLARLLLPADFGAIGMLTIFLAVSQVLIDGGFASALIQKKNPSQRDYSTVFYWNLGFSTFLYILLFILAPFIGKFFSMPILSEVLRGIGINLIISSIYTLQQTRLRKQLAFRTIAITDLSSYLIASGGALIVAWYGYGVWSLVTLQLGYSLLAVIIFGIITRWHPSLCFSKETMRNLFSFGGYLLAANILQEVCRNIQGIVIGKKYTAVQMGYYSQAHKIDTVTSNSIPQIISQVMFPVFSKLQHEPDRMSTHLTKSICIIAFLTLPMIGGLMIFAEPIIQFLYGEKWLACVPFYQVFCIGGFVVPFININFYVVAALGKSKTLFYWSFYKWGVLLLSIFIGINFGVIGVVWGVVISNYNTYFVNAKLACDALKVSLWSQVWDWIYRLILVIIPMSFSYIIYKYYCGNVIVGIGSYVMFYLVVSFFFNRTDCKNMIQILGKLKS